MPQDEMLGLQVEVARRLTGVELPAGVKLGDFDDLV